MRYYELVLTGKVVGAGLRACPLNENAKHDLSFVPIDQAAPNKGHPRRGAPTDDDRTSLPDVVYTFKSWTTKRYADGVKQDGWTAFPGKLWQRNYDERVVRNEAELARIPPFTLWRHYRP